jgi:phage FluMu protein gp41
MEVKNLIQLFDRDLDRLMKEIENYGNEKNLWKTTGQISNSAGNLSLHLVGNLKHFIGKQIGGFEYQRNREFEFTGKDVIRAELLDEIISCKNQITVSLEGMDDSLLGADYPLEVFGHKMSYFYFLLHLYGHLNYHLGQINYHRRLLDNDDH